MVRSAVCLSYFDCTQAWFKHAEPHPMWGIFPRLAYELFKDKDDGWKVTMKYFQNVVDTVRWVSIYEVIYHFVALHASGAYVCSGDDALSHTMVYTSVVGYTGNSVSSELVPLILMVCFQINGTPGGSESAPPEWFFLHALRKHERTGPVPLD